MLKISAAFTGNMFITYLPAISNGQTQASESVTTDEKNMKNSSAKTTSAEFSNNNKTESKSGFPNVNQLLEGSKSVTNSGCRNTTDQISPILSAKEVPKKKFSAPAGPIDNSILQQNNKSRRRSKPDLSDISTQLSLNKHFPLDELGPHTIETNVNNLDLSTLTSLYLESRRRVFGEEWTKRKNVPIKSKDEVGSIGVSKPRRLSPLNGAPDRISVSPEEKTVQLKPISKEALTMHLPTPGGLHLSANFSHLNLESSLNSSKGSRKSFRRMNSMSEIPQLSFMETIGSPVSQHRPSSAPDIHKKGRKESDDSSSPPRVTPARANTPTEPSKSARAIRPQLIGGSLATCSPDQIINVPQSASFVDMDKDVLQQSFTSEMSRLTSARLNSSADFTSPERPMRRSLPSRLSLNSQGSIAMDPVIPFLTNDQALPPISSRHRLVPINNPNKKLSLP